MATLKVRFGNLPLDATPSASDMIREACDMKFSFRFYPDTNKVIEDGNYKGDWDVVLSSKVDHEVAERVKKIWADSIIDG